MQHKYALSAAMCGLSACGAGHEARLLSPPVDNPMCVIDAALCNVCGRVRA
jgi:hypothetical protein